MASNPPGQCCTVGVRHEGTPTGEITKIGDFESYVSYPKDKSTTNAVLILTDIFGHKANNVQLIADQFAANGYFTVIPDLFHGDSVPFPIPEGLDLLKDWIPKHSIAQIDPIVQSVTDTLRSSHNVQRIGGVGYCFGAKYVIRALKPGHIDVGYVAHPSFVDEEELKAIQGPLSIAAAETDSIFPVDKRHASEAILLKVNVPYQMTLYSDVQHGFAIRADLSKKSVKFAKEQAFLQAVQWFDEFVKKA